MSVRPLALALLLALLALPATVAAQSGAPLPLASATTRDSAQTAMPVLQSPQELEEKKLLERVMQDMQRSGPSALRRHVPADYTIVANIGDAIVVRSADMKVFLPLQLSLLATDEGRKASGIHAIENTYGMIAQILAFEAVERQDYPTAIAYADRLLAIQPNHPQVQAERIVAYAKMGQCETGLKLAGEALASEDLVLAINRDLFLRRQGYCQIELGRFDDAKASYQAALELNPDDQLSHNQLTYIAQQTRSR
ncbi:tetratricopeptide repeat protein [Brevundimonas sp.]|uniref:tetratricopeptide repeat protein n=1 Tax=Brevundimonas sp. TaxID=1871086 RepID=UPI002FCBD6F2